MPQFMIRWETCKRAFSEFIGEGSLRDIYVLDTTIEDWRTLFAQLQIRFKLSYVVDGTDRQLPLTVDEIFATREQACPTLSFLVGDIWVVTHFFTPDEIEFDIAARDVTSQASLDHLLGFLQLIGDTVRRTVLLTPENDERHPCITYNPVQGEFAFYKSAT